MTTTAIDARNGNQAKDGLKPGQKPPAPRFPLVNCAALDAEDNTPRAIVTEVLFAGILCIIGGLFKVCKSLFGIDLAIAIATGRPFLNVFTVPASMSVLYFCGEGGATVTQEYARRIARSKGMELCDVPNLFFCFSVPRLENLRDLDEFCKVLDETAAEVVILDNLMLCLSGDEAGNVYKMGTILANVIRLCTERGVTPVFIHHFKRTRATADQYAPGELLDLTQAGVAENAGGWILITRRERFDPDQAGEHKLWLSIGGRVGHSSLHAVDVHEGRRSDPGGRRWEVELFRPDDARQAARGAEQGAREAARRAKDAAALEADRREIVAILAKLKAPETKSGARDQFANGHKRFDLAFASLTRDGTLQAAQVERGNGQTYPGWNLRNDPQA